MRELGFAQLIGTRPSAERDVVCAMVAARILAPHTKLATTRRRGCPVAVSVFTGNTADCKTVLPQVRRIQADFGIEHIVMVGDRGMISQKAIDEFKRVPGVA